MKEQELSRAFDKELAFPGHQYVDAHFSFNEVKLDGSFSIADLERLVSLFKKYKELYLES